MTDVVNIRSLTGSWKLESKYVYIGRTGKGMDGYFGNPFELKSEKDREEVYWKYVEWLKSRVRNDSEFRRNVKNLSGKTLVCFCKPKRCHGDALKVMADHLAGK